MIIKNKEIEIDKNDIFKNDILKRKETIENLSKLIMSYTEPFVLSVNANWGAGKTTFVKLWKAYLEKEYDIKAIYFSAWEDDFSREPLISLLGEINSFVKIQSEESKEIYKHKDLKEKYEDVKKFGSKVIRRGLPALVKGTTSGLLDIDKGFEAGLGAISEAAVKEIIDSYDNDKAITQQFRESLLGLLEAIDDEKPLVIFIDELDRCRPLYSIELLERIKHLFGVNRIIFVLSIDKEQLSESIKSQYGNIDAANYLRRFIDLEFKLNNPGVEDFCDFLNQKYDLYKIMEQKELVSNIYGHMQIMIPLSGLLLLSLREIEHIFLRLSLIARTIEQKYKLRNLFDPIDIFYLMCFLLVLKMKFPDIYDNKDAEGIIFELTRDRESPAHRMKIIGFYRTVITTKYEDREQLLTKMNFAIKKIEFVDKFNVDDLVEN